MAQRKKLTRPPRPKKDWTLRDVISDLKKAGAKEITDAMMKKEPYKSFIGNTLRNGKLICE
ncbi:MAG: hypothetical protein HYZ34_09280 [Ignavibacteriae bacterium]|nr:hypothetical protein [Ignavibacteriota bacterium]